MTDILDPLSEAIVRPRPHVEAVRAQSLLELGTDGRAALAWDWALTGTRPSPVTLSLAPGTPPTRDQLQAEAAADPEGSTAPPGVPTDFCDQLHEVRRILTWLVGDSDEIPVDAPSRGSFIGADDDHARTDAEIRAVFGTAQRGVVAYTVAGAQQSDRASHEQADDYRDLAWLDGVRDLLAWVLGDRADAPLTGRAGPPAVWELSLEDGAASDFILNARTAVAPVARPPRQCPEYSEGIQAAIHWLSGEDTRPPADQRGFGPYRALPD